LAAPVAHRKRARRRRHRDWAVATTRFTGDENGNVKQLHAIRVGPPPKFEAIPGTEFTSKPTWC
jgi:NADPH-dependent glutamate synthase beta subunit-like oxidoreductase